MNRLYSLAALWLVLSPAQLSGQADRPEPARTHVQTQSGFVKVAGGRLYYETAGKGPTIVFIHGNVGDRRHWDRQFPALAKEFRVIRYDVRGFGRSSLPKEEEAYSDADDLAALLTQLKVQRAHVVGWSMGSGIALDFALAYPDRVESLVSVGPWVFGYTSPAAQTFFAELGGIGPALAKGGPAAAAAAFVEAPSFAATIRDSAAGAEFKRIAADYSFWAFAHRSPGKSLEPPAVGRLSRIRVPVLILTAEHDLPVCLEVAALLDESVPDSRKVVIAGTGHLLQMEQPEEFNQVLSDFLATVGKRR